MDKKLKMFGMFVLAMLAMTAFVNAETTTDTSNLFSSGGCGEAHYVGPSVPSYLISGYVPYTPAWHQVSFTQHGRQATYCWEAVGSNVLPVGAQ